MKRCGRCGKEKERTEFPRDRTSKDGLDSRCRKCRNEYNREAYHNPEHPAHASALAGAKVGSAIANRRQKDPTDSYYWAQRERKWADLGIQTPSGAPFTRAEFWEFWFAQSGRCGMCGRLFGAEFEQAVRRAQVDHWHRHGKFGPARALLCWKCNHQVGDLTHETGKVLWDYLTKYAHPSP